jgi:gliding motility-associated-like protein
VVDDLNGDRLPDLAVNPFIGSNIYFLVNQSAVGGISFLAPQSFPVTGNLNNLAAGDFNNDGKIDLAGTKTIQDQVIVLINNTASNSSAINMQSQTLTGDDGPWGLSTADMDGDSRLDILAGNRDTNTVSVYRNTTTGNTVSFVKFSLNTNLNTRNISGGDIDGDGKPELVFTAFNINTLQYSLSVIRNSHCFLPVVEPAGPLTICTGETKRLQANTAIGGVYQWDRDNVILKTGPENFLDITTSGVYKVVVTTESGNCILASNAVIVQDGTGTVPADPVIYNNGPFCEGSDILLSTDDITNATYSWMGPGGFTATSREITIPDAGPNFAGSYSLVVKVQDCSSNAASTIVDVVTLPEFTVVPAGSPDVCEGGSVQLSVSNLAGYTYQWYRDAQPVAGATGFSIITTDQGTYHVDVTQTSSSCTRLSNNQVDVNIFSTPVPIFSSPGAGCLDIPILFNNSSLWDPAGVPVFTWDYGDGSPVDTIRNASHAFATQGTYNVTLTVGYATANCPVQVSRDVVIAGELSFEIVRSILDLEQLCIGDEVALTTVPEYVSYVWSTGETTSVINVTTTGDYAVTVTDENGCTGNQTEFVEFLPLPDVVASASAEEVFPEEEFQLEAQGALTYFWIPVEPLDDPTSATPFATIVRSTEFIVEGTDANKCSARDTVYVQVKGENDILVTPRKVFSPNGDGIDDLWAIENIERYPDASIIIFTAEGSTVYEARPYNNDWNGVYNGKDLPEGAYFYVIRVDDKDPKTGSITLIR